MIEMLLIGVAIAALVFYRHYNVLERKQAFKTGALTGYAIGRWGDKARQEYPDTAKVIDDTMGSDIQHADSFS